MAFVQKLTDQQQRHLCFKMYRLDDCYRSYPIFETSVSTEQQTNRCSEQQTDVQRTTWGIARSPSSLPWIQKPCQYDGKQRGRTRETPPKINSRKKLKHPTVKIFQTALFRASTKTKVLVFVCFDSCPCFVDRKLGKAIISLSWISTIQI